MMFDDNLFIDSQFVFYCACILHLHCVILLRTIITTAQYNLAVLTSHCQVTKFILSLCIKTTIAQNHFMKFVMQTFSTHQGHSMAIWLVHTSPHKRNIPKGDFFCLVPGVGKHPRSPLSQMNFLVTHQSEHLC